MKTLSLSLCALVAFGLPGFAQTLVGPGSVEVKKVQPAVVKTPEFNITGGAAKRYKIGDWLEIEVEYETKPEEIDELSFKFIILFERQLLEGEATYVSVRKGREHFAVMYVSPKTIDRLTKGKALTGASIENVWVEVNKQGQVLAKGQYRPGNPPNLPRVTGMVLNKDETPFGPLYYDRYEALKKTR